MARKPAENDLLSRRIAVLIKRDMTAATPRVIWAHEKPILEEIFGEGNVEEIPTDDFNEGYSSKVPVSFLIHNKKQDEIPPPSETLGLGFVFIGDPDAEYQRLADAYGRHADVDMSVVEKVYGRLQNGAFKKLLQAPALSNLPDAQLVSLIVSYGGEVKPGTSRDELLIMADDIGVTTE